MFKFKKKGTAATSSQALSFSPAKPLLYIPNHGESSSDDWPGLLWEKVFRGEFDVFISRAELDLRKAMQFLSFNTDSSIGSFQALAALLLPNSATALIWATQALLQEKYQKTNLDNLIYHRNHDARLLFQRLSRLDLDPWYSHHINWIPIENLSAGFYFPPGHPIPGLIYRKHPLPTQQNLYYPINDYFSLLFEERKVAFLNLLRDLGATKVIISPLYREVSSKLENAQSEVIKYGFYAQKSVAKPDPSDHPWLAYEPSWQSLVESRFTRVSSPMQCELSLDVMESLKIYIQPIISLISELRSMTLSSNYEEILSVELLHTKLFKVHF